MKKQDRGTSFVSDMSKSVLFGDLSPTEQEVNITQNAVGDEVDIPVEKLVDYHNHTYRVLDNEDMAALIDSIKENGIMLPILVRKTDDGDKYEIISGHRRTYAAKQLGVPTIKAKILDVDSDTADIMMVDTNLHRENILPSEKAWSYRVRLEAMKRQGKKTILDDGKSERLTDTLASSVDDSAANIKRYIKLTHLNSELLDSVDKNRIGTTAGAILANLSEENQAVLANVMKESPVEISLKAAENIVKGAKRGEVYKEDILLEIISGKKKTRATESKPKTSFNEKIFSDVLPDAVKAMPLDKRIAFHKAALRNYVQYVTSHPEELENL